MRTIGNILSHTLIVMPEKIQMAARKKGSRRIVVDGVTYLWRVPRRPSSGALDGTSGYTVTVQQIDRQGSVLAISVSQKHPALALRWGESVDAVLPSDVAAAIRQAIAAGWQPGLPHSKFGVTLERSDDSIPSESDIEDCRGKSTSQPP